MNAKAGRDADVWSDKDQGISKAIPGSSRRPAWPGAEGGWGRQVRSHSKLQRKTLCVVVGAQGAAAQQLK